MKQTILAILFLFAISALKAQNISREQALSDIDTLLHTLVEVHPNLYGNTAKSSIDSQIAELKADLKESVSTIELYKRLAPIVAQIGDAHTTFSSASSFAWAFKEAGCGTVIGEETGGMSVHYGDIITFKLPNSGLAVNVSHKRFWLPGADENDIHGVIPDIMCPQDKALEAALKCTQEEF